MRRQRQEVASRLAAALLALLVAGESAAAVGSSVTATTCAIAAGRDASQNTVTCNYGLTPEQLREVTKAAVEGATAPLTTMVIAVSKKLGISESATRTLLRIVGEQPDVPGERLAEVLTKVATDYVRLRA